MDAQACHNDVWFMYLVIEKGCLVLLDTAIHNTKSKWYMLCTMILCPTAISVHTSMEYVIVDVVFLSKSL